MQWLLAVFTLWTVVVAAPLTAGEAPHGVAGFVLGEDIAGVAEQLQMDTALPLRYQEYLEEIEIAPQPGYKSGLIAYGTCANPGRIVQIKLKYRDASRAFYDALIERVLLDLPFSTYRDHLKAGLRLVSEILWQRESDEAVRLAPRPIAAPAGPA